MIQNNFLSQLITNGLPLQTLWFMQDGATSHTANVMLEFLNSGFGPCVMSNHFFIITIAAYFWSPLSPDMNPCNFFLWGLWRTSCSHINHPINLRWEECLLSCAEELKKTCVTVLIWTCLIGFKKLLEEMVVTWSTYRPKKKKYIQMHEQNIWWL